MPYDMLRRLQQTTPAAELHVSLLMQSSTGSSGLVRCAPGQEVAVALDAARQQVTCTGADVESFQHLRQLLQLGRAAHVLVSRAPAVGTCLGGGQLVTCSLDHIHEEADAAERLFLAIVAVATSSQ